jgi:gamma-tubulin complex component 2
MFLSSQVSLTKLESLLDMALRTSNAIEDPFHEDLGIQLQHLTLLQKLDALHKVDPKRTLPAAGTTASLDASSPSQFGESTASASSSTTAATATAPTASSIARIKGLDSLTFDYRVEWPVSLILSKKALTKYQLIFRHLFHIKHVRWVGCDGW